MIKVPTQKLKGENKFVLREYRNENDEEEIHSAFIPVKTLKQWVKEEGTLSTGTIEKPMFKVKNQETLSASKNFLNATEEDFEETEYVLEMPLQHLVKWVEDLKRINQ
ncbi:hypothetical protein COF68_05795 [Bacillus toyonensis]|uniref:hypothetical protein n=1 Tax=Bacillus toyonensis TaxID=155322 RepID=UPI000BFB1A06|nr:hypothetical protein [Bacillus toyonensis]PHE64353.1 hypothetical protein COF68_05795 [Bacillus toyonensis]